MSKRVNYLCMKPDTVSTTDFKMVSCNRPSPLVKATTAKVLANLVDPIFDPDDRQHWASIHSNPPGKITKYAAFTENPFGKGKCIYLAPAIFSITQDAQKSFGKWLLEPIYLPRICDFHQCTTLCGDNNPKIYDKKCVPGVFCKLPA